MHCTAIAYYDIQQKRDLRPLKIQGYKVQTWNILMIENLKSTYCFAGGTRNDYGQLRFHLTKLHRYVKTAICISIYEISRPIWEPGFRGLLMQRIVYFPS